MGIEYDSGGNRYFASGSTALTTTGISSPVQIGAYTNWAQISASHYHGINIKTDGTLWTSGVNFHGILGKTTGATTSLSTAGKSSLAQIGALTDWKLSDCNQWMSAAVKTNGTLWVWGQNSSGQLGLGNTTSYSSPKQVGALTNWASVSLAKNTAGAISNQISAFAIKTDGTLWAWGQNGAGQLGLGNTTGYSSPKQVGALTNWASVFNITGASAYIASKTFALKTDGTLWAWGKNIHYGAPFSVSSPVQIGKATWKTIIPAGRPDGTTPGVHGLVGIKTDGTLWALAIINNTFSNLITGKNNTVYQFSQIGTDSTWKTVSASGIRTGPGDGNPFVAATKTNGTLWTWGNGTGGKLGLGSTTSFSSPKQVGALTVWQDAIAIRKRTMALRS
jgi:alpha-tubulin suppressor-like RCC1 family protein